MALPWPPSVNGMYRSGKRRVYMDGRTKAWYSAAVGAIKTAPGFAACKCTRPTKVRVSIVFVPPTAHVLDIDNRIKPVHDALEKAGLLENDSQVRVGEQVLLGKLTGGTPGAFVTVEQLPYDFGVAMIEIPLFNGRM